MMEFDQQQKLTSLLFARALADRDYAAAHAICSSEYQDRFNADFLAREFERIVPLDWGEIEPIELVECGGFPFIHIHLGGDVYSKAIVINSFVNEKGQLKIASFEFGQP